MTGSGSKRKIGVSEDHTMQRYNWNHTFNTRDLGYTPTANKNNVKPQRFIRSDAPLIVSDDVKEFLIRHNIRTVIVCK